MLRFLMQRGGLLVAAGFGLLAAPAHAAPPTAQDFDVRYYTTDASGERDRQFSQIDNAFYLNQARCQCGQPISATIRLKAIQEDFNQATLVEAFAGTQCDVAEAAPAGQFLRCAQLAASTIGQYLAGVETKLHPVWLTNGASLDSASRDPNSPDAIAEGSCSGVQGAGGVYMCAQTNATNGCQQDEFFLRPGLEIDPVNPPELKYDFLPPVMTPTNLTVDVGDDEAVVSWTLQTPGDIFGFRVLCEDAATGEPAAGFEAQTPALNDPPAGDIYYNAHNLCGGEPFSTVTIAGDPVGEGGCGDGFVDAGEACDDGAANADDGLCSTTCTLNVSAGLHALDWSYLCSEHLPFNTKSVTSDALEGGKTYNVVLVAYDRFGNPRVVPRVLKVIQSGDGGGLEPPDVGCDCRTTSGGDLTGLVLVALGLAGARRRRRA